MKQKESSVLFHQLRKQKHLAKQQFETLDELHFHVQNDTKTFWGDSKRKNLLISARFPDKKELLKMADAVVAGNLRFWQPWHMEQTITFEELGSPIDWQMIPNGDLEWTHALLRLYHFLDLAVAYDLTKQKKYLDIFRVHLSDFTKTKYNRQGVISPNLLDAALRINNLIRSLDLIKHSDQVSAETIAQLIYILVEETNYLVSRLRTKVGNWEFFITISILMNSVYLKGICDVTVWADEGKKRLQEITESEILADGNLIEACPMYHGQSVLLLLDYLSLLKNNNLEIPDYLTETINKMIICLLQVADPGKRLPRLGDSDAFDITYITCYAEILTGERYQEDQNECSKLNISDFDTTGWLISRFPLRERTGYFLFDVSGKPPIRRSWHSHADDLQFIFHDGENDIFIDPGRYTYSSYFKKNLPVLGTNYKPVGVVGFLFHLLYPRFRNLNTRDWRAHFRHTLSHNTVCCDRKMQRGYTNLEENPTKVERLFHHQVGPIFFSCAQLVDNLPWLAKNTRKVDSIRKESGPYNHKRTILGVTPDVFVIHDILQANRSCEWIASFHVAPNVNIRSEKENTFSLHTKANNTTLLQLHSNSQDSCLTSIDADWSSLFYNQKEESSVIRLRAPDMNKVSFTSIILPALNIPEHNCSSEVIYSQNDSEAIYRVEITLGCKVIHIYFNSESGKIRKWDDILSDASLVVTISENQQYTSVGFFQGSHVQVGHKKIIAEHPHSNLFQRFG